MGWRVGPGNWRDRAERIEHRRPIGSQDLAIIRTYLRVIVVTQTLRRM